MMELATMNQEDLDLRIVVFNNATLGMVREFQMFSLDKRYTMVDLKGGPDYQKLADAYGISYMRIDSNENLEEKVKQFLSGTGSVLLEVMVDPDGVVRKVGGTK
jgi:acetolactate synthase-1/2/3 large subunit